MIHVTRITYKRWYYARQIFTVLPSFARRPSQILVEVVHTTDTHPSQFTEQRWRNGPRPDAYASSKSTAGFRILDNHIPQTPDPLLVLALLLKVVEKRMGFFVRVKSGPQDVLFKYTMTTHTRNAINPQWDQ